MVRSVACAVLISLFIAGCAQPPVKYLPASQQRVDIAVPLALPATEKATIEISTDTSELTTFYELPEFCALEFSSPSFTLERQRLIGNAESAMATAGIVLSLGLAKPWDPRVVKNPQTLVREVPAGKAITWAAKSFAYSNTGSVSCGPLHLRFEPEAGVRYRLEYRRDGGRCNLQLLEIEGEKPIALPEHQRWTCSAKRFFGGSATDAIGLRTIKRIPSGASALDSTRPVQ